jgi:pyrroline-5-carboxylate reductase
MSSVQDSKVPTLSSVGFIGAGKMATAIMDGLVAKSVVSTPESIACSDVFEMAVTDASKKGYHATKSNQEVCQRSKDAIILAVKPNIIPDICADVMNAGGSALIISVAAGVTLETLEKNLPGRRVVRVMPNTACLVGEAASGYAMGSLCNADDNKIVQLIFGSCGLAREFKEVLLNAVTGVSGSGPAYVFQFIEALADGGVRAGLPREDAVLLAAQTLKGAAEMVLVTGMHPGQLKDMVCSPGGTTITGVDELEKGGLRTTVMQAVKAATRRSMQLGGITEEEITTKYNL